MKDVTSTMAVPEGDAPRAAFAEPGVTLAGRFVVRRFIAEGGMGAVYEAYDLLLENPVAIKTLRVRPDALTLARFRREIQLAHRVSHKNVCRIYDLFEHTSESGPVPFLSMELVDGETLAARLGRDGPFSVAEALPVALQLCAGVGAAHEAGVVHRDLKSSNVLLAGSRVVVSDFGLARAPEVEGDAIVTREGAVLGTPAFMSPEQVNGQPATTASDIYALGLVLYDLVTGKLPFDGDTPAALANRRLTTAPVPPTAHRAELPARWENTILRCLALEPSERFASAAEVARALAGEVAVARPRRRRWPLVAVGLALVAAAGTAAVVALRPRRAPPAGPVETGAPSLAVLGFEDLGHDPATAWIGTALVETLNAALTGDGDLRVIPAGDVGRARRDLALPEVTAIDRGGIERVALNLGVTRLVTGSYRLVDGALVVNVTMLSRRGEALAGTVVSGSVTSLGELSHDVAAKLRGGLGLAPPVAARTLERILPHDPRAARFYAEGLARLRAWDYRSARALLEEAVRAEPEHPLPHAALGDVLRELKSMPAAVAELKRARELAADLPREQRLFIEARYHAVAFDHERAAAAYRELHEYFPENVEYLLGLVVALRNSGKSADALALLDEARRQSSAIDDNPRVDYIEAAIAHQEAASPRAIDAAERAAVRARARGNVALYARARMVQGGALGRLRRPREAAAMLDEAQRAFASIGDRGGEMEVFGQKGNTAIEAGAHHAALVYYLAALALTRSIGAMNEFVYLQNVALSLEYLGQVREAETVLRAAVAAGAAVGDVGQEPWRQRTLARLEAKQGRLADAERRLEPLFSAAAHSDRILKYCHDVRATLRGLRGDLDGARLDVEVVRALSRQLGPNDQVAAELALIRLDLQAGRAAQAEATARTLAERPEVTKVEIEGLLMFALLAQGRAAECRPILARGAPELGGVEHAEERYIYVRAVAEARAALGEPEPGWPALRAMLAETQAAGDFVEEQHARITLARVARDRPELARLERALRTSGYVGLAEEARRR